MKTLCCEKQSVFLMMQFPTNRAGWGLVRIGLMKTENGYTERTAKTGKYLSIRGYAIFHFNLGLSQKV